MRAIDLHNEINPRVAIAPAAAYTNNTAILSAIIDTSGFEGVEFIIETGAITAGATFAVSVSDGNTSNLADGAVVSAANLIGTTALAGFASANANSCFKIGYQGVNRYLQLTITPTGNTSAFISALAVLGGPHFAPTANPPV